MTEGEHSKDSWSSSTSITIDGSQVAYAKSYSGYMRGHVEDVTKTCNFTDDQMTKIQALIKDKNFLKSDSLIDESEKYKSFERFVNLSMSLMMYETISKINVNGEVKVLQDKPLYINCYALINLIQEYIDKC